MIIIIKNTDITLNGVLANQKTGLDGEFKTKPKEGDLILIQQKFNTLLKWQKSIRWVMEFEEIYEDTANESDAIWGRHYKFIVKGRNLTPVEGFNIREIQVSETDYEAAQFFTYLRPEDETLVREFLGDLSPEEGENLDLAEEFGVGGTKSIDEIISDLDARYSAAPNYRSVITKAITRPTALKSAIIQRDSTKCKICGTEGFIKRNGEKYCEVHHMIEVNRQAPKTLQSWNVLILCANCHRQMHHGNVKSRYLNPGWRIEIDGKATTIR
jgi:5-methylcytosine-specific restriction protein A